MTSPTDESPRVPAYVALIRIGAVIGMSATLAFGIFLFIAAAWVAGMISIALAIPFYVVMHFVERSVKPPETPSL